MIRGEPERAPNTRGTGSGFICIYIYLYVCLWGDHFSEERVKFLTCKVMVVMRMRICLHGLRDNSSVLRARHKTGKVSAVPRFRSTINILVGSTFLSMKMTAWRLKYPLRAWLQVLGLMVMAYSRLLKLI